MTRNDFHGAFKSAGPVILPVIHVLDAPRTLENMRVALDAGVPGVFLINHDFGIEPFLPIIREVRAAMPDMWIGLNFLAVTGADAFPVLADLAADGTRIDAYWADDARLDERAEVQTEAETIAAVRRASGWDGLYFGGTAFKKQRPVDPAGYEISARIAGGFMDVVTTSGIATGEEADLSKIADFRRGAGDRPLALASGITPENAREYRDVDCFMVATGINHENDFYTIDPARLARLVSTCAEMGGEGNG